MGKPHQDYKRSSFLQLYRNYKRHAKKRGLVFRLSEAEFRTLTQLPCYYCGNPPSASYRRSDARAAYMYQGIDRVKNGRGYTIRNCVPCCKNCNVSKLERPAQEFMSDVVRAAAFMTLYRGRFIWRR